DWQRVKDAITPRTRMLMINSPHNPSGAMLSAADMQAVAGLLRDTGIFLLSDEVYEHIVFDGARHESALRHPELRERTFVISSFGKTYHCTGWKVGYCIAPPALSAEFRKVHQYNVFCTFAPAQHAFAAMLDAEPEHYDRLGAFYQAKRDRFREQLLGTKFRPLPVPGGYFQLVDYSAVSDLDDFEFCRWLTIEKGVTAIPLSPFYENPPRATSKPRSRPPDAPDTCTRRPPPSVTWPRPPATDESGAGPRRMIAGWTSFESRSCRAPPVGTTRQATATTTAT